MNTTEVKYNGEIKSFNDLFKLADKQFRHYETIEGINDWDEYDFSIDCSQDQMKFKDMLQIRFIEELTEASISIDEEDEHFWEEIGDAMNFFLSAYVMLGVDLNKFNSPDEFLAHTGNRKKIADLKEFSIAAYPVIEKVGYLCNLLKNRPWAQSNFLVSMVDFNERLNSLWVEFWSFMGKMNLTSEDVFEMFWKKYQVNLHRIRTGY